MDEEGTVVYYEGSPGALQAHSGIKDELVVERGGFEFSDPPTDSIGKTEGAGWKALEWWVQLVWCSFGSSMPWTVQERIHLKKMTEEIMQSPLLTDEDLQLLNSAMSDSTHLSDGHAHSLRGPSQYITYWLLALIVPVMVVMAWLLHPLFLIVGVALPFLLLLLTRLFSYWSDILLSRAQTIRNEYYSDMDKLLTQLTVTIRWLQEVEILSRGLTRPLPSLPVSRLDHCHTHKLLRGRVLCTCTDVVATLRASTREVCRSCDLVPELEDRGSYLVFTPLEQLHPAMREESAESAVGGALVGGDGGSDESITLESIKDACSLLAVQNSELLRRICLSVLALTSHTPTSPTPHTPGALGMMNSSAVMKLSGYLGSMLPLLRERTKQLEWSLNFHKNRLFGTPPTRSVASDTKETDSDLCPLLDEVHCLDLKAQCLLQRVRDMGVSLTSHDHQALSHDLLNSHLLAIQTNLRGVTDLVEGVASILKSQERSEVNSNSSKCSSVADSASEEEAMPVDQSEGWDEQESLSEEEVFEGYVQEDDLGCGRGQWAEHEEEGVATSQTVPLHVLQELKSVLTVRNSERDRRRLQRHGNQSERKTSESHQECKGQIKNQLEVSQDHQTNSPLDHTPNQTDSPLDHTLNHEPAVLALPQDMAAAIKHRRLKNTEDIFS